MKARIPKHREFIINFPDSIDQNKANEGWAKLQQIVEDYKKAHNGASVYAPTFIEDCEAEVKKLQEEYGFEYTVEYVQEFLICKIPSVHLRRGDLLFQGAAFSLRCAPAKIQPRQTAWSVGAVLSCPGHFSTLLSRMRSLSRFLPAFSRNFSSRSSTVIRLRSSPFTSKTMRPESIIRVRLPSSNA